MNDIAKIMNLQTNLQQEYRLHRDASDQAKNAIIMKYYHRLRPILHIRDDSQIHPPCKTISFARYFNDILAHVPKNPARDNYDKLSYIFDVAFMKITGSIKGFQLPITKSEERAQDCSSTILKAITEFDDYKAVAEQEGSYYRFLSLTVDFAQGDVIIEYVNEDEFERTTTSHMKEEGEADG